MLLPLTFDQMFFQILLSLFCLTTTQEPKCFDWVSAPGQADSLTVYVFLHDACVISQYYTPELTRLYETFQSKKVGFIGYFPNSACSPDKITDFAATFHLAFPLLPDYNKDQTLKYGITITPEVAVWDHRNELLIYRGRIDDSYVRVGKRKTHLQHHDLEEAIDNWLLNQGPLTLVQTQAIGCFISFTD